MIRLIPDLLLYIIVIAAVVLVLFRVDQRADAPETLPEMPETGAFTVRRLCRDLSPYLLEELGLMAALKSLLKESSQKFNFAYSTKIDSVEKLFTREARVNIYRIFQEALTNIGKHSNASRVDIEILKTKEFVSFKIVDNGRGFESNSFSKEKHMVQRGMGLTAMQERAHMLGASLLIRSKIGEGTELSFMEPVD